jgi:hypothetical protein
MGTRADFYIGRGEQAEWLGSIAWDGYPNGIDSKLLEAANEPAFKAALAPFLSSREDATLPEQGWPWPWDDSCMTDYAYAFDKDKVYASKFGSAWFDPIATPKEEESPPASFPNMEKQKNVSFDPKRSGVFIFGAR